MRSKNTRDGATAASATSVMTAGSYRVPSSNDSTGSCMRSNHTRDEATTASATSVLTPDNRHVPAGTGSRDMAASASDATAASVPTADSLRRRVPAGNDSTGKAATAVDATAASVLTAGNRAMPAGIVTAGKAASASDATAAFVPTAGSRNVAAGNDTAGKAATALDATAAFVPTAGRHRVAAGDDSTSSPCGFGDVPADRIRPPAGRLVPPAGTAEQQVASPATGGSSYDGLQSAGKLRGSCSEGAVKVASSRNSVMPTPSGAVTTGPKAGSECLSATAAYATAQLRQQQTGLAGFDERALQSQKLVRSLLMLLRSSISEFRLCV